MEKKYRLKHTELGYLLSINNEQKTLRSGKYAGTYDLLTATTFIENLLEHDRGYWYVEPVVEANNNEYKIGKVV